MKKLLLNPIYDVVSIQKSHIHGFGLFARKYISHNQSLGIAMIKKKLAQPYIEHLVEGYGEQAVDEWLRVVGARFINHNSNGNIRMEFVNGKVFAFAKTNIKAGEELTTDYVHIYQQINLVIPDFCVA